MNSSFQIARIFNIPFKLHWSFILYSLLIVQMFGFPLGLEVAIMWLISIGLHELGHALQARHYGIQTHSITFHLFGGVAALEIGDWRNSKQELMIALAGPAVSLLIAGVFSIPLLMGVADLPKIIVFTVGFNLVAGIMNLLPALPLDGGRVMRSLLAMKKGYVAATEFSVIISYFVYAILAAAAIYVGDFMLPVLIILLAVGAYMEGKQARLLAAVKDE